LAVRAWQLSIDEVGPAGETTGVPEAIWLLTIEPQPGADVTGACAAALPLTAIRFDSEPEPVRSGEYGMSPVQAAGRRGSLSWGVALVCLAAGVALHFGAGMAMLIAAAWTEVPGGGGQAADSVQVEIVSAEALQARGVAAVASEEKAVSEADEGGESTMTAAADAAPQAEDKVRPQETEPAAPPEDDVVAMRRLETSPEPERQEAEKKPEPEKRPEPEREKAPDETVRKPAAAQTAGRNAPAGSTPAATQTMLRAASRGEIKRFNASLWKAIQRRLPRQRGLRGTVEVMFSLTREGRVGAARISKSSGNGALDRVALRAMRSARFAKPPTGMSEAQLVYRIPIRFR
jgi:protein TonB